MFDRSRAWQYGLLWGTRQYWPLQSHLTDKWPQNAGRVSEGPYQARIESIKRSGERSQKVELKVRTYSGKKCIMSVWSCVNGHFMGKPHRDSVELDHILSWITCFPLQVEWFCCTFGRTRNSRTVQPVPETRNARRNANRNPRWSKSKSLSKWAVLKETCDDHRGFRFAFQWPFRVSSSQELAVTIPEYWFNKTKQHIHRRKSYAVRVDMLPGVLLRGQCRRRSKDFRVL